VLGDSVLYFLTPFCASSTEALSRSSLSLLSLRYCQRFQRSSLESSRSLVDDLAGEAGEAGRGKWWRRPGPFSMLCSIKFGGELGEDGSKEDDNGGPTSKDGEQLLPSSTAATDLASRIANRVVPSDRRGLSDGDAGEVAEDEDEAAFANATPEEVISSNVNLLLRVLLWLSSKGVPRLPLARRQPGDAAAGEVAKWGEEGPRSPLALSEGDDGGKSTGGGSGRIFGGEKSILGQSLTLPRARCSGRSSGATLLLLLLLEPRLLSLM